MLTLEEKCAALKDRLARAEERISDLKQCARLSLDTQEILLARIEQLELVLAARGPQASRSVN